MTTVIALAVVLGGSTLILLYQYAMRHLGYGDERDGRWTQKLAERRKR